MRHKPTRRGGGRHQDVELPELHVAGVLLEMEQPPDNHHQRDGHPAGGGEPGGCDLVRGGSAHQSPQDYSVCLFSLL